MLKRILVGTALFVISSVAFANGGTYLPAEPRHATNLYIGVGIARDTGNIQLEDGYLATFAANGSFLSSNALKADAGLQGVAGRLVGGYSIMFMNRYYLAVEGFGELTSNSGDISQVTSTSTASETLIETWKLREKYSYGVRLVPGVKISDSTLLYATVGWVGSRFQLSNDASAVLAFIAAVNGFTKTANGVAAGLGLQVMVANNVSMRAGWEWRRYESISAQSAFLVNLDNAPFAAGSSFASFKHPTTDQFYLDIMYYFYS